jgi:hypothetical protein
MRTLRRLSLTALLLAACDGQIVGDDADSRDRTAADLATVPRWLNKRVCTKSFKAGFASCEARIRVEDDGITPFASSGPGGLGPSDIAAAYKLDTSKGAGMTIAIVDAQDDPNAEKDLGTYRSTFGLPACTTANGCFKKVSETGTTKYPTADQGWAGEIALDLDMASSACPNCKILLVEANSASMSDLEAAENEAVSLGANVVSNSYGGPESSSDTSSNSAYNHAGVQIFVSAGDDGYGPEYPAASPYVTAVGGTSLVQSSTAARGWTESVWGSSNNANGGTGSGCSTVESKPSWQKDTGCSKRTIADVAAVADPNTGVSVYDTYGGSGWNVYGGTSAASPIVAGIMALTGHAGDNAGMIYANASAFFDVTSGTNGSCGSSYLCKAGAGYDGPTGNGTPNGGVPPAARRAVAPAAAPAAVRAAARAAAPAAVRAAAAPARTASARRARSS